jgi:hypothetical protein
MHEQFNLFEQEKHSDVIPGPQKTDEASVDAEVEDEPKDVWQETGNRNDLKPGEKERMQRLLGNEPKGAKKRIQ